MSASVNRRDGCWPISVDIAVSLAPGPHPVVSLDCEGTETDPSHSPQPTTNMNHPDIPDHIDQDTLDNLIAAVACRLLTDDTIRSEIEEAANPCEVKGVIEGHIGQAMRAVIERYRALSKRVLKDDEVYHALASTIYYDIRSDLHDAPAGGQYPPLEQG